MSDTTLGELLVVLGVISEEQRDVAATAQRVSPQPMTFGEVLVALRYCTYDQVEEATRIQKRLRSKLPRERAEATYEVAKRSKMAVVNAQRQLVATGLSLLQKTGADMVPTPMLGVSVLGG